VEGKDPHQNIFYKETFTRFLKKYKEGKNKKEFLLVTVCSEERHRFASGRKDNSRTSLILDCYY
jgi:hypothetical protein